MRNPSTPQTFDRQQAVATLAQAIWAIEGKPEGRDLEFWLEAEQYVDLGVRWPESPAVVNTVRSGRKSRHAGRKRSRSKAHSKCHKKRP